MRYRASWTVWGWGVLEPLAFFFCDLELKSSIGSCSIIRHIYSEVLGYQTLGMYSGVPGYNNLGMCSGVPGYQTWLCALEVPRHQSMGTYSGVPGFQNLEIWYPGTKSWVCTLGYAGIKPGYVGDTWVDTRVHGEIFLGTSRVHTPLNTRLKRRCSGRERTWLCWIYPSRYPGTRETAGYPPGGYPRDSRVYPEHIPYETNA